MALSKLKPHRSSPWAAAAVLFAAPLVATQFTSEVDWDAADFAIFGAMLLIACGAYELAYHLLGRSAYRALAGAAIAAAFVAIWLELAVGILGE